MARIEVEVGMQVSRLDAELGTEAKANTTLSTQLAKAFQLLGSHRDLMETCRRPLKSGWRPSVTKC